MFNPYLLDINLYLIWTQRWWTDNRFELWPFKGCRKGANPLPRIAQWNLKAAGTKTQL